MEIWETTSRLLFHYCRPQKISKSAAIRADELAKRLGRYWYDKNYGFWGKEGKKPDRIISAKLNVGGKLLIDASNGNTKVYFNGREVTKVELKVLKAFSRWIFSLYSFPVPLGSLHGQRECQSTFSGRSLPVCLKQRKVQTLLLVGLEGSGTSTIFKQVKFMYGGEFSEELQAIKIKIRSNLFRYLSVKLEGRHQFEEDALVAETSCLATEKSAPSMRCTYGEKILRAKGQGSYTMNPRLKDFFDSMLDIISGNDMDNFFHKAACQYASIVEEVWRDPAIQETYKRGG